MSDELFDEIGRRDKNENTYIARFHTAKDLWERLGEACRADDKHIQDVLNDLIKWYLSKVTVDIPKREKR